MNLLTSYSNLKFFQELDQGLHAGDEGKRYDQVEYILKIKSIISASNLQLATAEDNKEYMQSISFKIIFKSGTTPTSFTNSNLPPEQQIKACPKEITHGIFLLSSNQGEEEATIKSSGLVTINTTQLKNDITRIFIHELINIDKKNTLHALNLKPLNIPCNAIIIIDKYLFTNRRTWPQSLKTILDAILPSRNCTIPIHLTIVTDTSKDQDKRADIQTIEDKIRQIRGIEYQCNINIFHIDTYGHLDRHILTNYHLITSGHGFDLGPGKETVIHIDFFGHTTENGNATQEAYLRLAKQCGSIILPVIKSGKNVFDKIRIAHGKWQVGNRIVNNNPKDHEKD